MRASFFALERLVDADEEPVSLDDLKVQLRTFKGTSEDSFITNLGIAARQWAETYTGRAFMTQQWRLTISNQKWWNYPSVTDMVKGPYWGPFIGDFFFPATGEIRLRRSPIASIEKFVSVDPATGAETAVATDQYELTEETSKFPRLVPRNGANWSVGTYRIEFTAGFDDSDLVLQKFKQAILLHAEAHYDRDPEMMPKLVEAAEKLIEIECVDLGIA